METTKILKKEHEVIKTKIREFSEILESAKNPISLDFFKDYYEFFIDFADTYHHKKEEDIYFKWLLEKDSSLNNGPVGMMLNEHEYMRELLNNSKDSLEKGDYANFENSIRTFCGILYQHISKEDQILYKIADNLNTQFLDGDIKMMGEFGRVSSENQEIFDKWKDITIHPEVLKETEKMKEKSDKTNCCGFCS